MKELTETKFVRTGREYKLEKIETGFNLRLIDADDELKPIFKTFQQLLELSQNGQYVFIGFEEKKDQAELILLYCMQEEKNTKYELQITSLTEENENLKSEIKELSDLNIDAKQEIDFLKSEIENKNSTITKLTALSEEAKKLIESETESEP